MATQRAARGRPDENVGQPNDRTRTKPRPRCENGKQKDVVCPSLAGRQPLSARLWCSALAGVLPKYGQDTCLFSDKMSHALAVLPLAIHLPLTQRYSESLFIFILLSSILIQFRFSWVETPDLTRETSCPVSSHCRRFSRK